MRLKLFLVSLTILVLFTNVYSQYNLQNLDKGKKDFVVSTPLERQAGAPQIFLGVGAGIAYFNNSSGLNVGLFAEIKTETFSFVPQANYWKVNDDNNFEAAGLVRLRFKTTTIEPYVDGGIGLNFYNHKDSTKNSISETKVGLDLGGGLDFISIGTNYSIFIDAKYKIIIGDPNVSGYTLSGGIKFYM
jgi:opacity protein-like surface antigen